MAPLTLDLQKSAGALRLSLDKLGVPAGVTAEVAFDLDVSGSFDDEHRDGLTQDLLTRLVPWGMVLDPDQQLDVFTFSNGERHAHHVGTVTPDSVDGYIRREIINKVPGYNGGTDYDPVLRMNLSHFGWTAPIEKRGLFGFRKSSAQPTGPKKRSLVLFVTDGDNDPHNQSGDKKSVIRTLEESERRGDLVYFQFIGVSNQGGNFPFLQQIGDRFSNTGLVVIRDLGRWVKGSDEDINRELITDELIGWLKK